MNFCLWSPGNPASRSRCCRDHSHNLQWWDSHERITVCYVLDVASRQQRLRLAQEDDCTLLFSGIDTAVQLLPMNQKARGRGAGGGGTFDKIDFGRLSLFLSRLFSFSRNDKPINCCRPPRMWPVVASALFFHEKIEFVKRIHAPARSF